jgi:feruloyl-CoA synthase
LAKDVIITKHDHDAIGALIVPDMRFSRELLPESGRVKSDTAILANPVVRDRFHMCLINMARSSTRLPTRVALIIVLEQPPSSYANEITDKGSINHRALRTDREPLAEDLDAGPPSPRVLANK